VKLESVETNSDKAEVAEARLAGLEALAAHFVPGGTIVGDIMAPTVPYENYTFDENNVCPEEYAKRLTASKRND
jgi:hypothetical protein